MKLRPYLLFISLVIPLSVIVLLVWQGVGLFEKHLQEGQVSAFKSDFLMLALILGGGFFLAALGVSFFVENKIRKNLSLIKTLLLQIIEGGDLSNQTLKQNPWSEMAKIFLQLKEHLNEKEKSLDQKTQIKAQKEKREALNHLSITIAHEINNPLAGILGHTQLAKSKSNDPQAQNHLNIVEKEIRKIKEFVRNLMTGSENDPLKKSSLDIKYMILETIDLLQYGLKNKGIELQKNLLSTQKILGEVHKLQQVFVNLIANAIGAMENSPQKLLYIKTEDIKDGGVRIQIRDTGVGMTPELKEKIFDPFFTTKKTEDNKGMGLAISLGIINRHGGHIYVDSKPYQGTTFTLELPCQESGDLFQKSQTPLSPSSPTLKNDSREKPSVFANQELSDKESPVKKDIHQKTLQNLQPEPNTPLKNIAKNSLPPVPSIPDESYQKAIPSDSHPFGRVAEGKDPQGSVFLRKKHSIMNAKTLSFKVKVRSPKMKRAALDIQTFEKKSEGLDDLTFSKVDLKHR